MTSADALHRVQTLRKAVYAGKPAPNKPLLLLYTLGKWVAEGTTAFLWQEIQAGVGALLREYGFEHNRVTPQNPFHHLQTSGLWQVEPHDIKSPLVKEYERRHAVGSFTEDFAATLGADPDLAPRLMSFLIQDNFPDSWAEDLLDSLPAAPEAPQRLRRLVDVAVRDGRFRQKVLAAYGQVCALCRWDLKFAEKPIGLEAAHILWHSEFGPDTEPNGLSLCLLHHKLFDRGLWSLDTDHRVLVSASKLVSGLSGSGLAAFHRQSVVSPAQSQHHPKNEFLEWHRDVVFHP